MSLTLSEQTQSVVKSTIPALRLHGTAIVQRFYETLFTRYPSVRRQFNLDRQSASDSGPPAQVSALANAVLLYASRIDKLPALVPLLRPICEKHVSRGVSAAQYPAVGECLLLAMRDVLGDAASDEILSAWEEAYAVLMGVFIALEDEIRAENEAKAGWEGLQEVVVDSLTDDDEGGRVFGLKVDGKAETGMFVSVAVAVGEDEECMTSVMITEKTDVGFNVMVVKNDERATCALMKVKESEKLLISVPCGRPKIVSSSIEQ